MKLNELQVFFQVFDLLDLKNKLLGYYNELDEINKKQFIESVEYRYLPYFRAKIKSDIETYGKNDITIFLGSSANEKIKFIEQWILETKKAFSPQQSETKTDKLKAELGKYGFFELPKVKQLSEPNKQSLIELISSNPMPYGIAMFDELGFCEYLDREQGTKYKTDKILSRLYNENAKDGTSAKHYRRSLIKPLSRYKAGEYKETVKKDYQKLK